MFRTQFVNTYSIMGLLGWVVTMGGRTILGACMIVVGHDIHVTPWGPYVSGESTVGGVNATVVSLLIVGDG